MEIHLDFGYAPFILGALLMLFACWLFFWKGSHTKGFTTIKREVYEDVGLLAASVVYVIGMVISLNSVYAGLYWILGSELILLMILFGWIIASIAAKFLKWRLPKQDFETVSCNKEKSTFKFWGIGSGLARFMGIFECIGMAGCFLFCWSTVVANVDQDGQKIYTDKIYGNFSVSSPYLEIRGKETAFRKPIGDNEIIKIRTALRSSGVANPDSFSDAISSRDFKKVHWILMRIIKNDGIPYQNQRTK